MHAHAHSPPSPPPYPHPHTPPPPPPHTPPHTTLTPLCHLLPTLTLPAQARVRLAVGKCLAALAGRRGVRVYEACKDRLLASIQDNFVSGATGVAGTAGVDARGGGGGES